VVDVSSLDSCTVTPTSPNNLTSAGGALVDGTQNVTIECECVDYRGSRLRRVRWFFFGTTLVARQTDPPNGAPYYISANNGRLSTLVIPTFNDSYDGTYTCGRGDILIPFTTISLTLLGEKYHKLLLIMFA